MLPASLCNRSGLPLHTLLAVLWWAWPGRAHAALDLRSAPKDHEPDPRGTAPESASSPNEVAQPGEPAHDDDLDLERATPDPTPRVPRPLQRTTEPTLDVIEQAGVGGPTSFASAGVLEVGGSGALLASSDYFMAKFAPFVGWFVYDGVQLSYTHEIYGGTTPSSGAYFATMGVVEASLHVPFGDRVLGFFSAGPGIVYNTQRFGAGGKTRLGLDVLVGRSALLRPAGFFTLMSAPLVDLRGGLTTSRWQYGLEIAYAALF